MRISKLILALLISVISLQLNAQGIDFKHISYEEALSVAKKQNKLLFIDFYTQWCGPCKKLAKGPFLEKEVGDFYNANFVCVKMDAEHEGLEAARAHKVASYPTLLFIDGDGKLVFKGYGRDGKSLIASAQEALNSINGEYTLESLNEEFAKRQDDEKFLKLYISKVKDFGVVPTEGIEAWLKVQTEIKEDSPEMMRYLLDNSRALMVGGKAESILKENIDNWKPYCNKLDDRRLTTLHSNMLNNTRKQAYRINDADLLKAYINGVSQLPEDARSRKDVTVDQVKYYLMKNDYDTYRQYAEYVVDSIIKNTDVKAIHTHDKELYNKVKSSYEERDTEHAQNMLQRYKYGMSATKEVQTIEQIGQDYLKVADSKQHYEMLNKWIKFSYKLSPDYYLVDNWKANTLYKSGKQEKAIALKKTAIEKYPSNTKKLINRKIELQQMVDGEEVFVEE